jgi:hypothetical protein
MISGKVDSKGHGEHQRDPERTKQEIRLVAVEGFSTWDGHAERNLGARRGEQAGRSAV